MTRPAVHIASTVPAAFLAVIVGFHPVIVLPLLLGVLLPEIDGINEPTHRSWALHTFLIPALVYVIGSRTSVFAAWPSLLTGLNFVALGIGLHLCADFVYPRKMSHEGASWPVRPVGPAAHWGLLWLGISWAVQWFLYLSPEFLPWLVGI